MAVIKKTNVGEWNTTDVLRSPSKIVTRKAASISIDVLSALNTSPEHAPDVALDAKEHVTSISPSSNEHTNKIDILFEILKYGI